MTSFCLAASYDLRVYAFDLESGEVFEQFELNNCQANKIVIQNSQFYAAGYSYVFGYDFNSKSHKATQAFLAHDSNITDMFFDGDSLYTSGEDKLIKVWDIRSFQLRETLHSTESVNSICISADGYHIASGCEDGSIAIWDTRNGQVLHSVCASLPNTSDLSSVQPKIVRSAVRSLASTPDKSQFIALLMDGTAICYNFQNNIIAEQYRIHAQNCTSIRCTTSPDGRFFATAASCNTTRIFHLNDGSLHQDLVLPSKQLCDWIMDLTFSSDSGSLITGGSDGQCRSWDVGTGRLTLPMQQIDKCISAVAIISP